MSVWNNPKKQQPNGLSFGCCFFLSIFIGGQSDSSPGTPHQTKPFPKSQAIAGNLIGHTDQQAGCHNSHNYFIKRHR